MQNNTDCQRTGVKDREAGHSSVVANRVQSSTLDLPFSRPFDEIRATQARADLIRFTKTFFGLDQ